MEELNSSLAIWGTEKAHLCRFETDSGSLTRNAMWYIWLAGSDIEIYAQVLNVCLFLDYIF